MILPHLSSEAKVMALFFLPTLHRLPAGWLATYKMGPGRGILSRADRTGP